MAMDMGTDIACRMRANNKQYWLLEEPGVGMRKGSASGVKEATPFQESKKKPRQAEREVADEMHGLTTQLAINNLFDPGTQTQRCRGAGTGSGHEGSDNTVIIMLILARLGGKRW